jgi:hypothetical protein
MPMESGKPAQLSLLPDTVFEIILVIFTYCPFLVFRMQA